MTNESYSVKIEAKKQATKDLLHRMAGSVEGFRVDSVSPAAECDLVIIELGENLETDFALIASLQQSGGVGEVYVTSANADPEILLRVLRAGVKEFFSQPIKEQDVTAALNKFKNSRSKRDASLPTARKGKIINVLGTKGGMGTTTIAVNLAASLAELNNGIEIALVDMNVLFGEVPLFLNLKPAVDWAEAARNIARLDATYLENVLVKHQSRVQVLAGPTRGTDQLRIQPGDLQSIFRIMQPMFDFIVVDSGHRLDEIAKAILRMTHRLFLVSGLSLPALVNLKQITEILASLGYPRKEAIEVIINRSDQKSGIAFEEVKEAINGKVFWHMPNDYRSVMTAINKGEPLNIAAPRSKVAAKLAEIAAEVALRKDNGKKAGAKNGRFFLFR